MDTLARWLNVVDVEATCWQGAPPQGQTSEIIEIGLTVVDFEAGEHGERVAKHRILVRPQRSTVSGFCAELTGLTQSEVDSGVSFAEACKLLAAQYQSSPACRWRAVTTMARTTPGTSPR